MLAFQPPPIFGLGTAGGFELYLQNRGEGGPKRMNEVTQEFLQKLGLDSRASRYAQTLWRANVPQLYVDVDREKAKKAGVPINDIFAALSATLGNYYVNDFNKYGRAWQVLMSAEPSYRARPDDIGGVYVRSEKGEMIPLAALASVRYSSGPDALDRFNNLPAVKILGSGLPGVSTGQAIANVERIADDMLPPEFSFDWSSTSYQEKRSGGASTFALGLAVIMVFLILAAQYERWSLPFSVLLALPFGTFGALAAVYLRGLTNDVYFQIGLVTLLGLAAKNAILIVEFAVMKHHEGMSASAAALEGCAAALPADPDDFARVHPRRAAARDLHRRGRRRAPFDRHGGHGRHDRRDVPRDLLRAAVLQAHHRAPPARAAQHRRSCSPRSSTRATIAHHHAPMTPGSSAASLCDGRRSCVNRSSRSRSPRLSPAARARRLRRPRSTCRPRPPAISSSIAGGRRSATRRSTSSSTRRSPTISTSRPRSPASSTAARLVLLAQSDLYPTVDLAAGASRVAHDPGRLESAAVRLLAARRPTSAVGLQASYEVDLWGKYRTATAAAQRDLLATEFAREIVRTMVEADTARDYFNLLAADVELQLAARHAQAARRERRAAEGPLPGRRHRRVRPPHGGGRARDRRRRHRSRAPHP